MGLIESDWLIHKRVLINSIVNFTVNLTPEEFLKSIFVVSQWAYKDCFSLQIYKQANLFQFCPFLLLLLSC